MNSLQPIGVYSFSGSSLSFTPNFGHLGDVGLIAEWMMSAHRQRCAFDLSQSKTSGYDYCPEVA
jgi:hypothetical protein